MVSSGPSEEFLGIDFKDKRLSDRLIRIADCLGKSCHASIPAAADGRAEMEAIYRFVDNPKVAPQKLTTRHRGATLERIGQWVLITPLPIETLEEVQQVIHAYCCRWQIEIYFRVLKSGCRIQERYFETMHRLENCLAIYLVIAWKILYLCRLGQECPDLPCDVIFTDSEWKAVYTIVKHQTAPTQPPTINEVIRLIASLGGYVIRKTTNPGTQTLWLGLQRVHDLANAWDTFGPGSRPPK